MSLTWNGLKRADKWCDKYLYIPYLCLCLIFAGWLIYQLVSVANIVWGLR